MALGEGPQRPPRKRTVRSTGQRGHRRNDKAAPRMRQIILDTETTGLEPAEGHRIIEIGCVEMANRRLTGNNFHRYLQPDREIDSGAIEVHGITNEFLADKPRFAEVVQEFVDFIRGAELIIHNAAFDVGFLNAEFQRIGAHMGTVADYCTVLDTLL